MGGIAGFATAYYTAVDTCFKKNPAWLPESDIQHTKDYDKVKREIRYKPSQGIVTRTESGKRAWAESRTLEAEVFPEVASSEELRATLLEIIRTASENRWSEQ